MLPSPRQISDEFVTGNLHPFYEFKDLLVRQLSLSFGNLDSEFLQAGVSGNDGTEYPHVPVSIFKDGLYKMCLTPAASWSGPNDCVDSFTYKTQAVVIWPAGEFWGGTTRRPRRS